MQKKSAIRGFIILCVLVAGILAVPIYRYTDSPGFCNSCHYMNTKYASWERSSHADVTCIVCHSGPGTFGGFIAHIEGMKYVPIYLTGELTRPIIGAEHDDASHRAACLKCHDTQKMSYSERNLWPDQRAHSIHESLELPCTSCHADFIHGSLSPTRTASVKKELCGQCHRQENVLTRSLVDTRGPKHLDLRKN